MVELTMVIPTYNERENISELISKVFSVYSKNKIKGELIIVDDNSPDGTGKVVEGLRKKYKNLRVIHRSGKLGLSSAALDGFAIAKGNVIGLMDADLSHPPEKIGEMYSLIKKGKADFVIGTRYIKNGSIIGWDVKRKLMSRVATLLAKPFTRASDPMSGFFIIDKDLIKGKELNPRGFKILLELLIKTGYKKLMEVPIVFINREKGKSKASFKEIKFYLQNLIEYIKEGRIHNFFKFAIVGALGTIVNLLVLIVLKEVFKVYYIIAAVFAFIVAMTHNFLLNKSWTFGEKIIEEVEKKYIKFIIVSVLALIVNLIVLYLLSEFLGIYYVISQIFGIVAGLIINYLLNVFWVFAKNG